MLVEIVENKVCTDYRYAIILSSYALIVGSATSKTWLETQRQQKLNLEAANAGPDIEAILKDFNVVKKEVTMICLDVYVFVIFGY